MNTIFFLIFPDVYVFFFFLMYSINFFFPNWLPWGGGCPSPGACWAYPRAGPAQIFHSNDQETGAETVFTTLY